MNTIEIMLEALECILPSLEGDEYQTVKDAIAAGEAELRREPDAWMNPMNSVVISKYQKTQVGVGDGYPKFSLSLFLRERIK